jgi:ligand-binding sensor domain-containing protein
MQIELQSNRVEATKDWLYSEFSDVLLLSEFRGLVRARVCHVQRDRSLVDVFALLERNKAAQHIVDYSVSPTTLEQIFLQFVAQQEEDEAR